MRPTPVSSARVRRAAYTSELSSRSEPTPARARVSLGERPRGRQAECICNTRCHLPRPMPLLGLELPYVGTRVLASFYLLTHESELGDGAHVRRRWLSEPTLVSGPLDA